MIILGRSPGILDSQVNTVAQVAEEYMAAKVLEAACISVPGIDNQAQADVTLPSLSGSSSFSSSGYTTLDGNTPETTRDALEYIAGYLAKKFRKEMPTLGDFTYKLQDDSYNLPSWVQQLSFGGLVKPTATWLEKIVKWNKYFEIFHGSLHRKGPEVVRKLTLKIKKKEPQFPIELIRSFCKLRTIIRINFKNINTEIQRAEKVRKRKSSDQITDANRAKKRKMKKIVS